MGRGNKRAPSPHPTKQGIPAQTQDTSGTTDDVLSEAQKRKQQDKYEKVDPPFEKTNGKEGWVTWKEISLIVGVTLAIGSFFIYIVFPYLKYVWEIRKDVDSVQVDVKDLKIKTDTLNDNSVKDSQRLDNIERSISDINRDLILEHSKQKKSDSAGESNKQLH